MKTSKIPS